MPVLRPWTQGSPCWIWPSLDAEDRDDPPLNCDSKQLLASRQRQGCRPGIKLSRFSKEVSERAFGLRKSARKGNCSACLARFSGCASVAPLVPVVAALVGEGAVLARVIAAPVRMRRDQKGKERPSCSFAPLELFYKLSPPACPGTSW